MTTDPSPLVASADIYDFLLRMDAVAKTAAPSLTSSKTFTRLVTKRKKCQPQARPAAARPALHFEWALNRLP
ncbi:hypothetical protein AUG19_09515 [archaeon 13_1_20CM_2_54_9]|nr:MAG: hypothetical protein AUG19_09515 [archaeon 13_1_20CM_2_54_9]